MAALSGPASTMTVLRGETLADFVTKCRVATGQSHSTENALESGEGVIRRGGAPLEYVARVFTADDYGVPAIGRFTGLAEVALKCRERGLHRNQII
jgi:hypothetical protein